MKLVETSGFMCKVCGEQVLWIIRIVPGGTLHAFKCNNKKCHALYREAEHIHPEGVQCLLCQLASTQLSVQQT